MPPSDAALLVIDAQESFRHRPYWSEADLPLFLDRLQALVDSCAARGVPIVQIFHVEEQGPFSLASGHVVTMSPLQIEPAAVFHKRRHSALVGSGLDIWLREKGVQRLLVSGIRTEQCCETTARHASDLGFQVDFVPEATLTFPMTDAAGRTWDTADLKARTVLVLSGRFARVATVEEALAGPPAARLAA